MLFFVPAAVLAVSCESPAGDIDCGNDRVIVVTSDNVATRTTIEYELSDYSHLVWEASDSVAFVTDVDGDAVSAAPVTDGSFEARIPSGAADGNRLFVVYPHHGLEGLNIDKLKMDLPASQHQDTLSSSDGIRVPMYAVADIPEEGVNTVKVRYNMPAATVRFNVASDVHSDEKVLSVTMTAQDPIAGTMVISRPSCTIDLIKGVNEATVTVARPCEIRKGGYVYLNVMRGRYEGVTVKVTTDKGTYVLENGTFDLTDPDASLFKVVLPLDGSVEVPKTKYFTEISEGEQFSADGKYLIVYKSSASKYYVASASNGDYISYSPYETDGEGRLEATSDLQQYVFTITPVEDGYVTLFSEAVSNSAPSAMRGKGYVGSPASSYLETGRFVRGGQEDVDNPDTRMRYCWTVSFEEGKTYITGALLGEYRFVYDRWGMQFAPCKIGSDGAKDVVIMKMDE